MKALTAFVFNYTGMDEHREELRLVYKTGYFEINDDMKWFRFNDHYSGTTDVLEFIAYMRGCANWHEVEL